MNIPKSISDIALLSEERIESILSGLLVDCPKNPGKECKHSEVSELRRKGFHEGFKVLKTMSYQEKADLLEKHYECSYDINQLKEDTF